MPTPYVESGAPSKAAGARSQFEHMTTFLGSREATTLRHHELEEWLSSEGRELQRRLLQEHLDLRSGAEQRLSVVKDADGRERTKARGLSRKLGSVFGPVGVSRLGYQADGTVCLCPLDAGLNLSPELHSFGVRRLVAEQAAKGSYDEAVDEVRMRTGMTVHKRQAERLTQAAARDFEAYYAQRNSDTSSVSDEALLVLTVDGKGISMRKDDLRPATQRAAESSSPKLDKRLTKGEKRNRKRMAEVAAVYLVEPFVRTAENVLRQLGPVHDASERRPRPTHKRVWASVAQEQFDVIDEAFNEAERLDPKHQRSWVVTVDGNAGQIRAVRKAAAKHCVEITLVLDVIHVIEYLWKAAYCFHADASQEAQNWVTQRLQALLSGHDASQVAAGIRRSATCQGLALKKRKAVDACARYLINNRSLLGYAEALEHGFPIATGVIEGACRYLVKDRMDRTGARWSLQGAEAVLQLRALRTNGDFDAYWQFHLEQEHERNHRARYVDLTVPNPLRVPPSCSPKLRLVR